MANLKSGTYHVVAQGYENNSTKLRVDIDHNRIEKITAEKEIVPNTLEDAVFTQIPEKIIKDQTLDIDALTGASYSSKGLLNAVGEAVEQAGGNVADYHQRTAEPKPASTTTTVTATANDDYQNWRQAPAKVDKVIDTEFLIIGAGIAGLAAAVQAAQDGVKVTVLEKNAFVAGNGGGVEGIFGINTDMQKAAGIHAEKEDIISREQWRISHPSRGIDVSSTTDFTVAQF